MPVSGIELVNVTKQYSGASGNAVLALHNVSLTINKGEYIGVLGMNGSGKSTLARLLNGLIKPTAGKVYVNGMNTDQPANLGKIRRSVGMVFQNPDHQLLCPIVEEEIAFGLENLGLPLAEIRRRIEWALHTCGLEDERYHAPHLLSGGKKQMVALASVLAMLPEYLVLDEPTSMLDPASRRNLLSQLYMLNKEQGITVILISHDPEDLIQADRLVMLDRGSVLLDGTPRDVFFSNELRTLGLGCPEIYELIGELEASGLNIPSNVKSVGELVGYICQRL